MNLSYWSKLLFGLMQKSSRLRYNKLFKIKMFSKSSFLRLAKIPSFFYRWNFGKNFV